MAYHIVWRSDGLRKTVVVIVAILDSSSDLSALAASGTYTPGSLAVVADTSGTKYMLNASNEWKEKR